MSNHDHEFGRQPMIAIAGAAAMVSMMLLPFKSLADVHKCKDAKGKITYSDSLCQTQAAQLPVNSTIQYENSEAGRQNSAVNSAIRQSEAEISKIRARNAACNEAINEYLKMQAAHSLGTRKRREQYKVSAICGPKEVISRGIIQPASPPQPVASGWTGKSGVDSANRDTTVEIDAEHDYQNQKIPGFITHPPTDPHERDIYDQEMERQRNMDPKTWYPE